MFRLRGVSFYYSGPAADTGSCPRGGGIKVDDLSIAAEGITAIIGPSGSGKTTLLSILAGFVRPEIAQSGELTSGGRAVWPRTAHTSKVAFVFQSHLLLSSGSAILNALQGRISFGEDFGAADNARLCGTLATLGLSGQDPPLTAKRSRQLSGGEAQRTAILRAIVANPEAILCDEPTSSLDGNNAELALDALRKWSIDMHRPVVWVTHNVEQAAAYADHFVFVNKGRIHELTDSERAALVDSAGSERQERLRSIANRLQRPQQAQVEEVEPNGRLIEKSRNIGRTTYARWIARALSSDGALGGNVSDEAILPGHLYRLYARLEPAARSRPGWFTRLGASMLSYSRYGLSLVLTVLLFQIFAANFFGRVAQTYSDHELQNPAVARIVFENKIGGIASGRQAPLLYPDALQVDSAGTLSVPDLVAQLRTAVKTAAPEAELERVAVFGRRSLEKQKSTIRLLNAGLGAPSQCRDPLSLDTVVFHSEDPILRQTVLRGDLLDLPADIDAALREDLPAGDFGRAPARFFMTDVAVAQLAANCEIPPGALPKVEWSIGREAPGIEAYIIGAVSEFPPLYPISADLIVLEQDFDLATNIAEVPQGSLRVANAYFPIEGFDAVEKVLSDHGYLPRDDSKAAVQTLQRIERIAEVAPRAVNIVNLVGCAVVILMVLDGIFELNRRVLALFIAHGFRFIDILSVAMWHLLPAFVIALAFNLTFAYIGWIKFAHLLPISVGDSTSLRDASFLESAGLMFIASTSCILAAAWSRWRHMRSKLNENLQE